LIWNDIIDIAPVNKYAYGKMLLIGDAAHATTPNLGQGACQAIEDAVVLGDELKHNLSIETAFSQFEKRRLKRTHYIINTSRTIGRVAQVENKLLSATRNSLFRMMPASFNEKQLDKLYRVDF
jgi:2-polyprenyl-6-methoxyphenol hydroxylase-like FAD-dependent oxidoreductase